MTQTVAADRNTAAVGARAVEVNSECFTGGVLFIYEMWDATAFLQDKVDTEMESEEERRGLKRKISLTR